MYWRLEVRTIRHGGNLWPLHAPETVVSDQCPVVRKSHAATCLTTDHRSLTTASLVRNHALHFGEIAIADQASVTQLAFPFRFFRGEDVAQFGMAPLHLSRRCQLEALGSAFVRFQFRHKNSKTAVSSQPSAVSFHSFLQDVR